MIPYGDSSPPCPRVFISAAEPSADLHGASLIKAFQELHPGTEFAGMAGPKMQSAGCRAIADMTGHAAMLTGVMGNARRAIIALRETDRELSSRRYDAAVLLDSPMLNLPIALRAKMRAIPVLYYIAPQLWAWGGWRLHKIRSRVDKLAVVLPFEEAFFRKGGLDATFVGHPLFDVLHARSVDRGRVAAIQSSGHPVIAILPGSRRHVVREVLPGQLRVAAAIRDRFRRAHIGISVAGASVAELIRSVLDASCVPAALYDYPNGELLSAADLTLVASGTATLEVAYHGCPMIVMYNGSKLMYHLLGRWLVHTEHLSLVNILAGRELVPEFMPYYDSTIPIARSAIALLSLPARLNAMRAELAEVIAPINRSGASRKAARLLANMMMQHAH